MSSKLKSHSWTLDSEARATKVLDKSAFLHGGTGVPFDIRHFFLDGELAPGESFPISLLLDGGGYAARIEMDNQPNPRSRLFWGSGFSEILRSRFPHHYTEHLAGQPVESRVFLHLEKLSSPRTYKAYIAEESMSNDWSREELRGSVEAYLEMQRKERDGVPFTKKSYYEKLSREFTRTEKAFEYRMQNISYIMSLMGRNWLSGLKPAKNVGAKVGAQIESFIAELGAVKSPPVVAFEIEAREAAKRKVNAPPEGNKLPGSSVAEVTQFKRDPGVKAWVLNAAKGMCECCESDAPFVGSNGQPYLEVHHVRRLSDGGSDTIGNAVALCPNCHRELHCGENSRELTKRLYVKVSRLVNE